MRFAIAKATILRKDVCIFWNNRVKWPGFFYCFDGLVNLYKKLLPPFATEKAIKFIGIRKKCELKAGYVK